MVKKYLKKIMMLMMVVLTLFSLAACSTKLSDTFTNTDDLIKQSFTFKENNVVEVSAFGIDVEGEYEIKDNMITITYTFMNLSYDWEKSFEKDGDSIFIDGTEFVREK